MSDDNVVALPLTAQDEADIEALSGPEMPDITKVPYHTILHVWRESLKPALTEKVKVVTPLWASRITQMYKQLDLQEMRAFQDKYFAHVIELYDLLLEEIASDSDSLSYDNPEDDIRENHEHYINLLRDWQLAILDWEMQWDCVALDSHVELAAISEAQKMFFGENGITAFLDSVGFIYTEDDQAAVTAVLLERRGEL